MDQRGGGDWSTLYLIVVAIIAAVIMFGVLKPMYAKGAHTVQQQIRVIKR